MQHENETWFESASGSPEPQESQAPAGEPGTEEDGAQIESISAEQGDAKVDSDSSERLPVAQPDGSEADMSAVVSEMADPETNASADWPEPGPGEVSEAGQASDSGESSKVMALYDQCVIGNYPRLPIVIDRAAGSQMWDIQGKRYLDLFPGWGCSLLGYCHPKVTEAIHRQADKLVHIDNIFYTREQGRLAELLGKFGFGGKSFFCNSGAEANEAAIKLARLHTSTKRYKIITMERSFHGRTYGAMSATAQSKTQKGFEPLLPGFVYVPYNDIDAVAEAVNDETAAIMLEPIQGEGGVNVPDSDYLAKLRELCDENQMLLIFDEVQTGCGRTGKWFGYQHSGVVPDIMTLAKALGNGVPIGAMVAQPDVADSLKPGTHASTYGANPLVVAAAIATLETIEQENLLDRVRTLSAEIIARASALGERFGFIETIRGQGLMIGIELSLPGKPIFEHALAHGLRINCTQETVLRLLPAMTLTDGELDEAFDILARAFEHAQNNLVNS